MEIEGGCYCGAVRYQAKGDAMFKGVCYCRECAHVSGAGPNVVMAMPDAGFTLTKGATKSFQRKDLENPVTREFCADCGTHLLTRAPTVPGVALLKVGTLDDPKAFGQPQMAIFTCDKESYHVIPEGVTVFERGPNG